MKKKYIVASGCSFTNNYKINVDNESKENRWKNESIEEYTWVNWLRNILDEDDFATEAEDTLTILTKHIDSLNIDGDKKKLDALMRSLYTESLDILV